MPTSPRYGFDYLEVGETVPSEAVNEALERIEAGGGHFIFKDRDLLDPTALTPAAGDTYLIGGTGAGAWAGQDNKIAYRLNTGWSYITVIEGFTAWVNDENVLIGYDGAAWNVLATPSGTYLPLTGGTLSGDLVVPAEVYGVGWNGSNEVPTKNDVYDKIETLGGGTLDGLSDVVITSAAQGDILYHNGTNFVNLGAGTSGQYLKTQGAAANPVWATVSGAGGSAWNLQWSPMVAEFPASNYATLDSRNNHPCLDFDTTTGETAYFTGVLPADYSGAGITVHLYVSMTSATSGTVGWLVAIERIDASSLDIDADSFAADNTLTAATVPGTAGQVLKQSLNISNGANMDSLAAGELFRLRITRDVANDTAAGDAELLRVMMVSQ
jgi:hypothetical protein